VFELLTQVLMQQATQAVPAHSPFAHLAADHQGAAAAARWMSRNSGRSKRGSSGITRNTIQSP
jgi:hypothetical protein